MVFSPGFTKLAAYQELGFFNRPVGFSTHFQP